MKRANDILLIWLERLAWCVSLMDVTALTFSDGINAILYDGFCRCAR